MSSHSRLGAQQVLVLLPAASHGSHNVLVRGRARSQGLGELWETGRFAQGITTKHVPSRVCARQAAKQVEIGRMEDGFPQRLKENGLLLQLGDEALLEKTTEMECGQGVSIHRCCECGWTGARTQLLSLVLLFPCSEGASEDL